MLLERLVGSVPFTQSDSLYVLRSLNPVWVVGNLSICKLAFDATASCLGFYVYGPEAGAF